MVSENIIMLAEVIMKVNGSMGKRKGKVILLHMAKYLTENGQIIQRWVLGNIFGKTGTSIRDNLFRNLEREKEHIFGKMDSYSKDGGKMIN